MERGSKPAQGCNANEEEEADVWEQMFNPTFLVTVLFLLYKTHI